MGQVLSFGRFNPPAYPHALTSLPSFKFSSLSIFFKILLWFSYSCYHFQMMDISIHGAGMAMHSCFSLVTLWSVIHHLRSVLVQTVNWRELSAQVGQLWCSNNTHVLVMSLLLLWDSLITCTLSVNNFFFIKMYINHSIILKIIMEVT